MKETHPSLKRRPLWRFVMGPLKVFGIALLAGILMVPAVADDDDDDDDRFVANEIVIKLNPASGATIADIHTDYGTTTLSTVLESAAIYLVGVTAGTDVESLAERFEDDARLLYAEPNYITSVPQSDGHVIWAWAGGAPTLGQYPDEVISQAPAELLNLPSVHELGTARGVVVAVIDTGIDLEHPNLVANILSGGYDYVDDDAVPADERMNLDADGDGRADENYGHGTHVAGAVLLVAPDAKLLPLRVLDAEGRGNVFTLVEAINHAVKNGADIINLSLGIDFYSDLLEETIEEAIEEDVLVVAAAGNGNSDVPRYPAAAEDVLGVGSVDGNDVKSTFSNWGSWIGVSAPGESLISAFPGNSYAAWSGTSMAAPLVSGQAAMLKGLSPATRGMALAHVITATAFNIDALNPSWAQGLGAGRIDLVASAEAVLGGTADIRYAIGRLNAGWEEARVVVDGTIGEQVDEEGYRFSTGDTEVLLNLWDEAPVLVHGTRVRVTGELEWADTEDQAAGLQFELDADALEFLEGPPDGGTGGSTDYTQTMREGTLAELVAILETSGREEMSVRTTGILSGWALGGPEDDDDYLFSDDSGITVILDLDSRARLDFLFSEGMELHVIGELGLLDEDERTSDGLLYELDALQIEISNGISLDLGQQTSLAEATISDWIGYFWKTDVTGWYYHATKGFVFSGNGFGDDDWFYSISVADWIYASRGWYPFVYSNAGGWHYLMGSSYGEVQHAYRYDTSQWIMDFWQ